MLPSNALKLLQQKVHTAFLNFPLQTFLTSYAFVKEISLIRICLLMLGTQPSVWHVQEFGHQAALIVIGLLIQTCVLFEKFAKLPSLPVIRLH